MARMEFVAGSGTEEEQNSHMDMGWMVMVFMFCHCASCSFPILQVSVSSPCQTLCTNISTVQLRWRCTQGSEASSCLTDAFPV